MEHVEVLRDLRDLARAAIKAGDWKVDGACDPDSPSGSFRHDAYLEGRFGPV